MKRTPCLVGVLLALSQIISPAAEKTWTGMISDSMCGASHSAMQHGGKKVNDRDCTLECVKDGAQYVLVSGGKVLDIENQDFAGLKEHAGHTVKVTGETSADNKSIKVSKIEGGTSNKVKASKG